jgi:hypothetical protein
MGIAGAPPILRDWRGHAEKSDALLFAGRFAMQADHYCTRRRAQGAALSPRSITTTGSVDSRLPIRSDICQPEQHTGMMAIIPLA